MSSGLDLTAEAGADPRKRLGRGRAIRGRQLFCPHRHPRGLRVAISSAFEVAEPPLDAVGPPAATGAGLRRAILGPRTTRNRIRGGRGELLRRQGDEVLIRAPGLDAARGGCWPPRPVLARASWSTDPPGRGGRAATGGARHHSRSTCPPARGLIRLCRDQRVQPRRRQGTDARALHQDEGADADGHPPLKAGWEARGHAQPSPGGAAFWSYFHPPRTAANLLAGADGGGGAFAAIPQMRRQFFPDIISNDITIHRRLGPAPGEDVRTRAIVRGSGAGAADRAGRRRVRGDRREGRAALNAGNSTRDGT